MTHHLHRPERARHRARPRDCRRACRRTAATLLAGVAGWVLAPGLAFSAPLDDIRQQVEGGQFEQAYRTGIANPQLLGDVHFDFVFGIAAISSGRVPEGLLALERHLAAVPGNDRARLELGRGYFLLGEFGRARAEFEFVLRNNPPAGVRATIDSFLAQMQSRESVDSRPIARLYAEVGAGHDTNVNGATFHDVVQTAVGPSPATDRRSRQLPDDFWQFTLGGQQTWRASNRLTVLAGADIDHRPNINEHEFDLTTASGYAGFTNLAGPALWRFQLTSTMLMLGGSRYRDSLQVSVEPTYTLSPDLAVTPQLSYTEQHFTGSEATRDARVTALSGSAVWNPAGWPWAPSFNLRLGWAQEDNKDRLRAELDKDRVLLRATGSVMPWQGIRLALGVTAFREQYGGEDFFLKSRRLDNTVGVDAVLSWAIDKAWSVRSEGSWTVTRSNQDFYDISRKTLALKLRYQY
jgi:Surface lipoprotein assembly modifier